MENKYKYFIKNFGLFTISSFGPKLLSIFLVPLYTSILSTDDFGTSDLLSTISILLIPIFTLNIFDAVMRFSFEKDRNMDEVFSSGLYITLKGSFILFLIFLVLHFIEIPFVSSSYYYLIYLLFLTGSLQSLLANFARGIDQISRLVVSSLINSVGIIVLNIVFLVVFRLTIEGFLLAQIVSNALAIIYLFFSLKIWNFIKIEALKNKILVREMMLYSYPLIFTSISWWITTSSNKFIITHFLGVSYNGLYSVALKIPTLLTTIQGIFIQAWNLSVIKEYETQKQNDYFYEAYKVFQSTIFLATSFLLLTNIYISKVLFSNDFFEAWQIVPLLLFSILFSSLSSFIGGLFTAIKNTKIFSYTTVLGASLNIVLNLIFINIYGLIGASLAVAISYFLIWLLRFIFLHKYVKIKMTNLKMVLSIILLSIQAFFAIGGISNNLYQLAIFASLIALNYKNIYFFVKKFLVQFNIGS